MTEKFKKILSVVLTATVITSLSACSLAYKLDDVKGEIFENTKFDDDTGYTSVAVEESVDSTYYEPIAKVTHGYDSLTTDSQKECYAKLNDSVYRISEDANENGLYSVGKVSVADKTFTEKDIDVCIKAYTMDHPEVFWIANRYTYGSAGSQFVVQLYSYVSGTECHKRIEKLNDAVEEIVTNVPSGLNKYHLEKYIHNAVLDNCTYSTGVTKAEDGWEDFTVYGTLINGGAVCEGYAHTMCLLLNKVGLDCYYVNGFGESNPHMWNTVKIDGNWYHLDSTWDDNENAYYNYFNLTDEQIQTDHIISPLYTEQDGDTAEEVYNVYLPECNSDSANYFVVESTYIYDFDENADTMVYDLVQSAENRDEEFTVRFDSSIPFDEALDLMFNEEPYYMFDYIRQANQQLDTDYKINESNVSIIILENFNSVVVKLEYN